LKEPELSVSENKLAMQVASQLQDSDSGEVRESSPWVHTWGRA
jgi:hypothetical protein